MKLTKEIIFKGRSQNGGWSRNQVRLLGLDWPLEKGWIDRLVGTELAQEKVDEFLGIRDAHVKNKTRKPVDDISSGCNCGLPPWELCRPDCPHAIGGVKQHLNSNKSLRCGPKLRVVGKSKAAHLTVQPESFSTVLAPRRVAKPKADCIWLNVPFEREDQAKALGAWWSPEKKKWFIPLYRKIAPQPFIEAGFLHLVEKKARVVKELDQGAEKHIGAIKKEVA